MSNGEQWMSAEELETWVQASGREPAIKKSDVKSAPAETGSLPARKLSANRLALALLSAASQGATKEIQALLDLGAEVNCRTRALPGKTPYRIAIEGRHDEAALVLLKAGGFPEPERCYYVDSDISLAFSEAIRTKSLTPEMSLTHSNLASQLFIRKGKSWKSLTQAHDLLPLLGPRDDALLMRACFFERRLDLALQGFRAGVGVDQMCWKDSGKRSHWSLGLPNNAGQIREPLLIFLAEPKAVESMDPETCEELFLGAMNDDDVQAMRALLDAGLRPSPNWTMGSVKFEPAQMMSNGTIGRHGFLAMAAAREKPQMWDLAKCCPPAINAAKLYPELPASLSRLSMGRLQEYAELAPIDARGPEGRSLTHCWALSSRREPRDGWATLARKFPELFEAHDDSGQTGYGLQVAQLRGTAKDTFLSSIARIEKRDVARFVGTPAKPSPSSLLVPRVRPRL